MTRSPSPNAPPMLSVGEAMIELSDVEDDTCRLGVAGDCFNVAVGVVRGGAPAAFFSAIGDDPFSDRIERAVRREGVDARFLQRVAGEKPGLYGIQTDARGERSFVYWRRESAARRMFAHASYPALRAALEATPLLFVSGITLGILEPDGRRALAALAQAVRGRGRGGAVAFDTNYRPRCWESEHAARQTITEFGRLVTVALPTHDDDHVLMGDASAEDTAARWRAWGAQEVVVKDGPRGALIADTGWRAPPAVLQPLDTTGAGDAFTGAYLSARLQGGSVEDAVAAGHRYAGQVLMIPGAIPPRDRREIAAVTSLDQRFASQGGGAWRPPPSVRSQRQHGWCTATTPPLGWRAAR